MTSTCAPWKPSSTGPPDCWVGRRSFYDDSPSGLLIGDLTGDGLADWVVELSGQPALAADDFLL